MRENTNQKTEKEEEFMVVGRTLQRPQGRKLYKFNGMWLSKQDIAICKADKRNN